MTLRSKECGVIGGRWRGTDRTSLTRIRRWGSRCSLGRGWIVLRRLQLWEPAFVRLRAWTTSKETGGWVCFVLFFVFCFMFFCFFFGIGFCLIPGRMEGMTEKGRIFVFRVLWRRWVGSLENGEKMRRRREFLFLKCCVSVKAKREWVEMLLVCGNDSTVLWLGPEKMDETGKDDCGREENFRF